MLGALLVLAIGYRYYSAFLAAKVCALDDARVTPAYQLNDGQNYHPTHKWVLFGHHFAAISGAGPLIGPVLAIQFGYAPGLLWLLIGVVLAGAVQDMLVLAASVRHGGHSLAEIARAAIGPMAGRAASIAILFIVIVALAGLGVVVVKALGGEHVNLRDGSRVELAPGTVITSWTEGEIKHLKLPPDSQVISFKLGTNDPQTTVVGAHGLVIAVPAAGSPEIAAGTPQQPATMAVEKLDLPKKSVKLVRGSSWGTFTIACTVPIALLVGLYMYKIRKGRVVEASLLGAVGVLAATFAGSFIPDSPLDAWFSLSRGATIWALCGYGFVASVLPVWLLLCPRDYLSSFLKIGTVILLVAGIMVANPKLEAPAINPVFVSGGGPNLPGAVFPFVFICIMCGAISGFHALVSSGTTPKMISKEGDVRIIGYGAMLIEGLVGVVALLAAASLPQADYWAINIDQNVPPAKATEYAAALSTLGLGDDRLADIEKQVGGESLRGRTGGAVTLAVGMSEILTTAMDRVSFGALNFDKVKKYWYHFAIMFEALFILTTIDTGTRIARFLLQEALGKIYKPLDRVDWMPGAVLCTAAVTAGWGVLIWTGSIDTIWPMFGIANQLLAAIALCVVTSVMFASGKGRYALITVLPLIFVTTTTITAAVQMISGRFADDLSTGLRRLQAVDAAAPAWPLIIKGGLNIAVTALLLVCFLLILADALPRWYRAVASSRPA